MIFTCQGHVWLELSNHLYMYKYPHEITPAVLASCYYNGYNFPVSLFLFLFVFFPFFTLLICIRISRLVLVESQVFLGFKTMVSSFLVFIGRCCQIDEYLIHVTFLFFCCSMYQQIIWQWMIQMEMRIQEHTFHAPSAMQTLKSMFSAAICRMNTALT